jgi:ankyrin repeat protein
VPTARILTYGYDTHVKHPFQGQISQNTVHDHAANLLSGLEARRRTASEISRPLLFIVHSLGGIVVKEALRQSKGWNVKPHLHNIFERTIGCVFFGTPHRGSDPRNAFHHIISSLVQGLGWKPNKQIVDTLMPNSERLASLREEFPVMCHERKWQLQSFQEEYGLAALLGTKVVDDSSSCLGDPIIEAREHIASNHMDMCRFHGLNDPGYRQVAAAITRIISSTQHLAQPDRLSHQPQLAHRSTQSTPQNQSLETDHVTRDISGRHSPSMPNGPQSNSHTSRCAIDGYLRSELVQMLHFDKIDQRLTMLSAAYGRTCRWFLDKPEYMSWLDEEHLPQHGGFLWIKGNPGTGKSTLMKFLFERAKDSAKDDLSHIYLSFFFNARGDVDEKSTHGLYRSLLHQLFRHAPDLVESLEWMTLDGARGIQRSGWHEEALKQTLKHAIKVLSHRSLTIFVDALDECDQTQATDMVETFEELCELAQSSDIKLRICFSSRHYPTITIQTGVELVLEHETGHNEDIRTYIKSKLRLGKTKQGETLRAEILEKSSGIFLWVVLVIEILNREFPQGSITQFRARLKSIPPKLHELFEMILKRDGDNLDQLRISFNLILFAKRPLKPQELYFAVQLGLDKFAPTDWDMDDISLDQMKSFVSTSSKGLAQVTRNKASEVQFIHESVRDFLLGKHGSQWTEAPENTEGCGHDMLKECCLAQLQTPAADLPEQLPKASESTELRTQLPQKYPFLEYSIQHVFYHSDGAQRFGIDQSSFISAFPLAGWVALNNALEKFDNRRYTKSVSMLYVLAEKNTPHLIASHLELARLCFEVEDERYGTPVTAALATDSTDAARAMYSSIRELSSRQSALDALQHHISSLCRVYEDSRRDLPVLSRDFGNRKEAFHLQLIASEDKPLLAHYLLHQALFSSSRKKLLNLALVLAAQRGDLDLATLVLSQGGNEWVDSPDPFAPLATEKTSSTSAELRPEGDLDVEPKDGHGWTPFWWAAKSGHTNIATLLLENGADINAKVRRKTCLWWAVTHNEFPMLRLLLNLGADIETTNFRGQTPLLWAVEGSEERKVTIQWLLERGARLETKYGGQTPLSWAAYNGHEYAVSQLLDRGAKIEARAHNGQTPLAWAAQGRKEATVQLLLNRGAEIETRDDTGQTPLSWAAESSNQVTVQLLLDRGAEIEARDNDGRTPLSWAARSGNGNTVQLLLDRGAEIEARDNTGRTPLSWAARSGNQVTVQLLLDRGAEIEARDNTGRTPLSCAADLYFEHTALLLLEKGAEIETRDNNGRTPLSWASSSGYNATVLNALLAGGADPTSLDLEGKSPLHWAEKNRYWGSEKARLLKDALRKLGKALS